MTFVVPDCMTWRSVLIHGSCSPEISLWSRFPFFFFPVLLFLLCWICLAWEKAAKAKQQALQWFPFLIGNPGGEQPQSELGLLSHGTARCHTFKGIKTQLQLWLTGPSIPSPGPVKRKKKQLLKQQLRWVIWIRWELTSGTTSGWSAGYISPLSKGDVGGGNEEIWCSAAFSH